MYAEEGRVVPLGYGKYFRADYIVGLEPIEDEEGRGPGRRTRVFVAGQSNPIIASRSDGAILRDMIGSPRDITAAGEQRELLADILETIRDIDPMLRRIVHEQGSWDLDRLERRIADTLREADE
jgi:hypothetical protein